MSIWDVLEIAPTCEESAIKKAYAKKLKLHHPEDDPEGYQRLREAYDAALKQAKRVANSRSVHQESMDQGPETGNGREEGEDALATEQSPFNTSAFFHTLLERADEFPEVSHSTEPHPVYAFLHQVEELYDDFYARIDPESWQALLNEDIVWELEYSQSLRNELLSYLEDNHHLPRAVWELLDSTFGFREHKEELLEHNGDDFVEYIIRQIEGTMELRYDCFAGKKIDFDIDQYLDLRESAQYMLMHAEAEKAGSLLAEANKLFSADPDLQLMRGKYYLEMEKDGEALECFDRAIALQPDDPDGYWHRALLYYDRQQYEAALADCMHLLSREGESQDQNALCLAGRCQLELGHTEEARATLRDCYNIDKFHVGALAHLLIATNIFRYGKFKVPFAERRKIMWNNFLFFMFMFFRMTWFFIFIYFILSLYFDLHPYSTGVLIILLLWNAWKTLRVKQVLTT